MSHLWSWTWPRQSKQNCMTVHICGVKQKTGRNDFSNKHVSTWPTNTGMHVSEHPTTSQAKPKQPSPLPAIAAFSHLMTQPMKMKKHVWGWFIANQFHYVTTWLPNLENTLILRIFQKQMAGKSARKEQHKSESSFFAFQETTCVDSLWNGKPWQLRSNSRKGPSWKQNPLLFWLGWF